MYSGLLASASDDNTVRFWRIDDAAVTSAGEEIGKCDGHTDSVLRVTWQSDGQLLASGGFTRTHCSFCHILELSAVNTEFRGVQLLQTPV